MASKAGITNAELRSFFILLLIYFFTRELLGIQLEIDLGFSAFLRLFPLRYSSS